MSSPDQRARGCNLVVCCDGTSNEIGVNISNVLKLCRMAEKDEARSASSTIRASAP